MRAHSTRARVAGAPTLGQLRAFVELSLDLHFGHAARRLGVSQSSLSETIRRLEGELGTVLFERTSRRVELTDAGAELLPRARDVLMRVERMRSVNGVAAAPPKNVLRIGIAGNGFGELTRPIISAFRDSHSDARVVLREVRGAPDAFLRGRFDVALVRRPFADERVVVHDVATEPRSLLVPADHALAGTEGAPITDVLDEPFVAIVPSAPAFRDYWLAADQRGGERPRIGGEAWSVPDTLHAVADLGLVTTAGRSFLRSFPVPGIAMAHVTGLAASTFAVALRVGDDRPLVRAFLGIVREVAARAAEIAPGITGLG